MKRAKFQYLKLISLISLFVSSTLPAFANNPIIDQVTIGKTIQNQQIDANSVQLWDGSINQGYPYIFNVNIKGQNIDSITPPTVSGPIAGNALINGGQLVYDASNSKWNLPNNNTSDYAALTLSDFNTKYADGGYTVVVNGVSIPFNLSGDAYPNAPKVILSGGKWVSGQYQLDVSKPLTITTNEFTTFTGNQGGHIGLELYNIFNISSFSSQTSNGFLTYTIPANTLVSGQTYSGSVNFSAIVDLNSPALLGNINAAYYGNDTTFTISTTGGSILFFPVPGSFWLFATGLLGLIKFNRNSSKKDAR